MNLIEWDGTYSASPGVVLLFGSGLIGGAIEDALLRHCAGAVRRRLEWSWPQPLPNQIQAVDLAVRTALATRDNPELSVIWAAGRSGFASTPGDMAREFAALERVLQTARSFGSECAPERRNFVHLSSAGGLFEGQVACGPDASPRPLRAYGHGKVAQEQCICNADGLGERLIIRPSSVYGYREGARRGLISALAANAIQRRPTTIFGSLTTLRDYVHAQDIGSFVAQRIAGTTTRERVDGVEICHLASARPSSVFEVLRLVEGCLGPALNVRIDPRPENARDNTFLPSILPKDFRRTSLELGVASTVRAVAGERFVGVDL